MKIAIVVHGRFHAFDLARELLRRGHEVTLFTNYPMFVAKKFGVPVARVRSLLLHGALSRAAWWLRGKGIPFYPEAWLHTWFGQWVATQLGREYWNVVICWSGVGEEAFRSLQPSKTLCVCHRSSSHIRFQAYILKAEETRVGVPLDRPSDWIVDREEREYGMADVIYVPSTFVKQTFLAEGIPLRKISVIQHAVNTKAFRPDLESVVTRCNRILSGEPLRVLNIGTFSFRKGMWDMAEVMKRLTPGNFLFRFVGPVAPEASDLVSSFRDFATFIQSQPQHHLPAHYEWGDMFVLPTIEDGYPFVLAQASAACLPILTTPNGAGTDLVREGETGWVLPIRSPEAFIERLRWCDTHREELAAMVQHLYDNFRPRDWSDVAKDFETLCEVELEKKKHATRMMERPRGCS